MVQINIHRVRKIRQRDIQILESGTFCLHIDIIDVNDNTIELVMFSDILNCLKLKSN